MSLQFVSLRLASRLFAKFEAVFSFLVKYDHIHKFVRAHGCKVRSTLFADSTNHDWYDDKANTIYLTFCWEHRSDILAAFLHEAGHMIDLLVKKNDSKDILACEARAWNEAEVLNRQLNLGVSLESLQREGMTIYREYVKTCVSRGVPATYDGFENYEQEAA